MQVLKEETGPFESWYQQHLSTQNLSTSFIDENSDFLEAPSIESNSLQSKSEESITKNEPINSSKIAIITESMVNKAQEVITKFEQNNDEQIAKITKLMIDKTQERLAKFEEIDDTRQNLALKHQDRLVKVRFESLNAEVV
jgi:hypothetical protein